MRSKVVFQNAVKPEMILPPIDARINRYTPGLILPAHTDGVSRISVIMAGAISERCGAREEYARAGSVVIKPGDAKHQNRFGPQGAQMLSIALPEAMERALFPTSTGPWRWLHSAPIARLATRLWLCANQSASPVAATTDSKELLDRLIELLAATQSDTACTTNVRTLSRPAWLTRIQNELDDCFSDPPSVTTLAQASGVHPVYLARMFRRFFACTISEYIHARRVVMVLQNLTKPSANLSIIAQEAGYADQSHFNRSWRRELGLTPQECRRLLMR